MSEKSSTWYEEERSRILYTCEEKYDGNMVAYVIDLESQLIGLKLERDQLMNDLKTSVTCCEYCKYENAMDSLCDESDCDCVACRHTEECKCINCSNTANNWEWRGMPDEKGSACMTNEDELKKVWTERDHLLKIMHDVIGCAECIHEEKPADNPICKACGILGKNWVWRGVPDEKGSAPA